MKKLLSLAAISALTASVSLNATTTDMEKVVVTASKTEQPLGSVTANVTVVTAEMIGERHFSDMTELLSSIGGVSFSRNGGLGKTTDIFLRGMATNRTLVLIDGIRFQDPSSTAGAAFAHLMISDIERIEVLKGAQSGVWGADAAAGVINIITKKAVEGFSSSVRAEYGSYNTKKYGASLGYKNERFDLKLAADKVESDGFTTLVPKGKDIDDYEADGYVNTTVNLRAGVNLGEGRLEGVATAIDALSDYDGGSWSDPVAIKAENDTLKSDVKDRLYRVAYTHRIGKQTLTLSNAVSTFGREEVGTTSGVKIFNGRTTVSELNDAIAYGADSLLLVGASQESYVADYEKADGTTDDMESKNSALFATNSNTLGGWTLSESIRHDDYDTFDSVTTGKLGVKYAAGAWLAGANFGTAYNAPNTIQVLNPWGAANESLEPETVKSYDASLGYGFINVTYFKNEIDNMIEWSDMGTPADWTDDGYDNVSGVSTIAGVELEAKQAFETIDTAVSLNYTSLDAKNSDGQTLKRRPKDQLGLNLDWYVTEPLHIGLNAQYVGERYEQDGEQGTQTGNYSLFNAVGNYVFDGELSGYVKVENLGDKRYRVVDGYATAERSVYVGLNARF